MIQLLVVILLIILIHKEAPGFFPTVGIIIGAIVGLYVLFGVVMMLLEKGYQLNESHKIIETVRSNKIAVIVVLGIVSMIYQIYNHSPHDYLGIVSGHIIVFGGIIYYIRKKEDAGK